MESIRCERDGVAELLASTLDELDTAVVVAREGGEVVAMNAAARSLTAEARGLEIRHGVLQLRLHSEQMQLRAAIGRALSSSAAEVADACVSASRPDGGRPFVLRVRSLAAGGGTAAAAIFIVDAERRPRESACHLRIVYGLTKTELRVVRELMGGSDPSEIATSLSVSTYTVRTHLRNIFAKSGARNQADLVRLVASIPAFLRDATERIDHEVATLRTAGQSA